MKFDRLTSSIALNAQEEPTVYMAMCMVQSLFQDVESASRKPLSQTKLGDEQLPALLTWLGRQLVKIYSENSEELVRNRERLDKMMEKVREQETSLSELAEVAKALHTAETRYAELSARLDEEEEKQQEAERLEKACASVREQLKVLEGIDPAQLRAELQRLSEQERVLSAQRSELTQKLEAARSAVSALEQSCGELGSAVGQSNARLQALTSQRETAGTTLAKLRAEISGAEAQLKTGGEEKDRLIETRAYLEQQTRQLQGELEAYERDCLAPLRAEQEALAQKKTAMETELDLRKKERDKAVYLFATLSKQLAAVKQNTEAKKNDLMQKQQAADAAVKETEGLKKQLETAVDRLDTAQREAEEIRNTRLPELESLLAEQEQKNRDLEAAVAASEDRKEKLLLKGQELSREDEALKAEVAKLNAAHEALIASSEANSEEIQRLRQNVEALKGKNDQEKERQYLQQLKEEQEKLTALNKSCSELETQTAAVQNELAQKKEQLALLQKKKEDADRAVIQINRLTQESAPYGGAVLQQRVSDLENRLHQLTDIYHSLDASAAIIQTSLGSPPRSLSEEPERLSDALENCGRALNKLQKSLVVWANDIKTGMNMKTIMEEQ